MTTLYEQWLAQIAAQEHVILNVCIIGLVYVLLVWRFDGIRRWSLWLGVILFWATLVGLMTVHPPAAPPDPGISLESNLWYDEAFTWSVSRLPFDRMMQAIAGDVHPPLWYVIEWVTIRVMGGSEMALRLPAYLFGWVGLWLTYRLGLALGYARSISLWAAFALLVAPAWRYYSLEARMYTLLACAVLTAVLGLATERRWLMALGMIAALYTHNLGVVYVAVIAGLALGSEALLRAWHMMRGDTPPPDQRLARHYFVTTLAWLALVGLAWTPWLVVLLRQIGDVAGGFWIPDYGLGGYLMAAYRMSLGMGIPVFLELHGLAAIVGLGALSLWWAWRDHRAIIPAVLLLIPAALLALISEIWRPIYLYRALLPSLPFLALLAAAALVGLGRKHRRPILAVLMSLLVLCLVWQRKEGVSGVEVANVIGDRYRTTDTIYHANLSSYILCSYYLPEGDGYQHIVWPDAGNLSQALSLETQRAMGIHRAEAAEALFQDGARLWIVWIENPMTTVEERAALEDALAQGANVEQVAVLEGKLITRRIYLAQARETTPQ